MFLKQLCLVVFLCIHFLFRAQEDSVTCDASCHCIRNLTPAGVMISHVHPKNEWMVSYRFMQMGMGDPIQGNSAISELSVYTNYLAYTPNMQMDMHMVMGMVGITDRLTAMVMLNFLSTKMDMHMLSGHAHTMNGTIMSSNTAMHMNTQGLGDTKLQVLYGFVKNERTQLVANFGASIPTGSIQQKGNAEDMFYPTSRLPYMMQLGSGTIDFQPGITFVYQKDKLAYSVQAQGTIRPFVNSVGYRYGNELNTTAWLGYNWWKSFGSTIRVEGNWMSKFYGSDKSVYAFNEISANPNNYGGTRVQGNLGLSYQFEEGFIANHRIAIEAGLPVYQQWKGIQNKLNQTWIASWSYSF